MKGRSAGFNPPNASVLRRFEQMNCYDDRYGHLYDWYLEQLRLASPDKHGNDIMLVEDEMFEGLAKAGITSGDAGVVNAIYSLDVFIQYSVKPTAYGMLPKNPWQVQGYRAVSTPSITSGLGVAEAQAVGTEQSPTYVEIAPDPKEIELPTSSSQRLAVLAQIADAISPDQNRVVVEKDFFKALEADILQDFDTLPGDDFESIDRVCASTSEQAGVGATAGDEDIYGIDRGANSWMDANSDHNSGVDRDLTISLIESLREDQEPFWDVFPEQKVFLTGLDTWTRWSLLEGTKQRLGSDTFTVTVNEGITSPGVKGGFKLATWDGIPIIRSDNVQQDTISRIYLLDLADLGIAMGKPISMSESDNMFEVGHKIVSVWYGIGELYATKFKSQGKLRDLQ